MDGVFINSPMMSAGGMAVAMLVPLAVVFLLFVMPAWLWLHYRRGSGRLAKADRDAIDALLHIAERLEARLATVERAVVEADAAPFRHDMPDRATSSDNMRV